MSVTRAMPVNTLLPTRLVGNATLRFHTAVLVADLILFVRRALPHTNFNPTALVAVQTAKPMLAQRVRHYKLVQPVSMSTVQIHAIIVGQTA